MDNELEFYYIGTTKEDTSYGEDIVQYDPDLSFAGVETACPNCPTDGSMYIDLLL